MDQNTNVWVYNKRIVIDSKNVYVTLVGKVKYLTDVRKNKNIEIVPIKNHKYNGFINGKKVISIGFSGLDKMEIIDYKYYINKVIKEMINENENRYK